MDLETDRPAGDRGAGDDLAAQLAAALGPGYAIERELGAGGMARVFLATEVATGRRVAVKVLAPAVAACCDDARFRREMNVVAGLDHPHVVPLLGTCASCGPGQPPYFLMPYVEGETLRARLDRAGPLPVAEAVRLLRDVAGALAYAHGRGVVHRDIKPANVLLSGGRALVADFGVAKALQAAGAGPRSAEPVRLMRRVAAAIRGGTAARVTGKAPPAAPASDLTRVGLAVGTPAYMAPEQALGDPATDHRADVYALGVLAYEVLTGMPPFGGSSHALLAAHVTEAPQPVAARRPSAPSALDALVIRLLAKDPEDRPQGADEVIRLLDAVTESVDR